MGFDSAKEAFGLCKQRVLREFASTAILQQAMLIHDRVDAIESGACRGGGQEYVASEAPGTYEQFNHQGDYWSGQPSQ